MKTKAIEVEYAKPMLMYKVYYSNHTHASVKIHEALFESKEAAEEFAKMWVFKGEDFTAVMNQWRWNVKVEK